MKKVTVAFLMIFMIGAAKAQDFKKVNNLFLLTKVEDARMELDKLFADPKTASNAEAQLWKARVYGSLFADSASRSKHPQSGVIALEAFNKYMTLDPQGKKLKEAPGAMQVVDQLYVTSFNLGRSFFDREMWDSSFTYFKHSYEMGNYITQQDWRGNKQAIDTFTVLFTAYAAQNSKKLDEAAKYYQMFADLKIGGQPYESVYDFLGRHYLGNKNKAMFDKYIAVAKELYPANTLWKNLEAAYLEDNLTLTEKLKMYDDAVAAGKMSADDYFNYGTMFANVNKNDAKDLDSLQIANIKKKAGAAFVKAFELDSKNGLAAYNAGVIYNNEWNELQERYYANVGSTAALKAKRDEIDKLSLPVATEAVTWMEKAFTLLDEKTDRSKVEKNSYSTSIKILANLYEFKRDKAKGKSPADYDKFNAKFNLYNSKVGN